MLPTTLISNFTEVWIETLLKWKLDFLVIPTIVVTLATLVINPILLSSIFLSRALRQETRYLLVANILVADIVFLVFNLIAVTCNALRAQIPLMVCDMIMAVTVTAYSCAIFTITLMVVDTYVAVRWPLQYHVLLPPARAHCILLGAWVLAAMFPLVLVIMMEVKRETLFENGTLCLAFISFGFFQIDIAKRVHIFFTVVALICATLISFCYIRLYMVTRAHGIWHNRCSRARVTLLAHGVLLLLYFSPGLVFTVELILLWKEEMHQDLRVWISMVNMCVFMLLPRAFAPYLYGLRYREISLTLMQLLQPQGRLSQS